MNKRVFAAVLGAVALAVPAGAAADPGHGKTESKAPGGKGTAKRAKKVTFVFNGSFGADGVVTVSAGNAHVRKGGFVGQPVTFDFASARVVAADTNGDQKVDLTDVKVGDVVQVKARLGKGTKYAVPADGETAEPPVAGQLIDETNAPLDNDAKPADPQDPPTR